MTDLLLQSVIPVAIEILTVLLGVLVLSVMNSLRHYVDRLKKKDELGIVDSITDAVVEWAEAEFKGGSGLQKRDFAVEKALEILESKGIFISEDEVIAGIENGVNKLKNKTILQEVGVATIGDDDMSHLVSDGISNLK